MKVLTFLGFSVTVAALLGLADSKAAADCAPAGQIQFICGVISPEDLSLMPGSQWVITSGNRAGSGGIRAVSVRDKGVTTLYPAATVKQRRDTHAYPNCPGPLDASDPAEKRTFAAHGIYLKPGRGAVHTLYVVHHGTRESVEVFELEGGSRPPALTWIGCTVAPENQVFNAVVALPEGGLAATGTPRTGTGGGAGRQNVGAVWEWHTGTGWTRVPGSDVDRINGLEVSNDGKWFYIAGWGDQTFVRLSRGQTPFKKDTVPTDFHIDNLRLEPDGSLFAAGQGGTALCSCPTETANVAKINPKTMEVRKVISFPYMEGFVATTTAIQVGKEVWLGTNRGDRIGHFPAP